MPDKENFNAVICAQVSPHGEIGENISPTIKQRDYKDPAIICVHGSQDPICNTEHANAVNRNRGLKNCVVCFGLDAASSNSMKSENPNSGCHKTEVSRCLDTSVPDAAKN